MDNLYNIQIGEEDDGILNYVKLNKQELNGVIKVLTELYNSNNTPVSIEDTYGNEFLYLGFE